MRSCCFPRLRAPGEAVPSAGYVVSRRWGLAVARPPALVSAVVAWRAPRRRWAFPEHGPAWPGPDRSGAGRRWLRTRGMRPGPPLRAVFARRQAAGFPLSRGRVLPGQASAREGVSPLFLWVLRLQAGLLCLGNRVLNVLLVKLILLKAYLSEKLTLLYLGVSWILHSEMAFFWFIIPLCLFI